jgi:hypothetical protein
MFKAFKNLWFSNRTGLACARGHAPIRAARQFLNHRTALLFFSSPFILFAKE